MKSKIFNRTTQLSNIAKISQEIAKQKPLSKRREEGYAPPVTPVEQFLAALWAQLLKLDKAGVHDNFFEIGGNSLLGTQVIARVRKEFSIELPLITLFHAPTIAGMSQAIEAARLVSIDTEIPALVPTSRENDPPLCFCQQRLWLIDQLEPGSPRYNVCEVKRLEGALQVDVLERSFNALIERHEVFRTIFAVVDEQPVQRILPDCRLKISVVELSGVDEGTREIEARRLAAEEALVPFDLGTAPLLRAKLLRLRPEAHLLVVTMHHMICDRWSFGILFQELSALYEAFCSGQPSPLPPLRLQYPDYAVWQRKYFQGAILEEQLSFWRQQLAGAPTSLDLPTDRVRPAVQTFNGAKARLTFPKELTDKLSLLSREQGATLFMVLLAGFQALLSRYSNQEDVMVGSPIANRNRAEIENMIGFFANTLVFRAKLTGDPSFRELLDQVKDNALGAYANQDLPFEKLVQELQPERTLSQNPLFQVLFSLENIPRATFELSGLKVTPVVMGAAAAKFDISVFLSETPHGISGLFEYNTDLFDGETIERMVEHYRLLLEAVVTNPAVKVSQIALLTEKERRQVLVDWNATEADYPRDLCVHQLIEQQVERSPDAIACVFPGQGALGDQNLSYRELNTRANQLAHALQKRGIGPGQLVGIFVERSLEMMVGLLGIQKTGAAYVPLDPGYPSERIRLILQDAQVPLLVTQHSLAASLPENPPEVICLDSDLRKISSESEANPVSLVTPQDLVYVIFTSGSTGRPKGVEVRHQGVVNLLTSMTKELKMGPSDVFPALASVAFDMCIPELYLTLISGGRVVIGKRHLGANGEELAELLRRVGATIVHATPTTWNLLLEAGFSGKGLKRVIGAEPLAQELSTRLLQADNSLFNFYGPTETTVWSAFHHLQSPNEPVVVGRPLANTQIYILDKYAQAVPIGVFGEIHIGGDGVAAGYLRQPEMTVAKFIPDPFSTNPGARIYKTGDIGRFLADGRIEFQGRSDHQVKIRGFRIELGEIESVLAKHVSVRQCLVVAREDQPGMKRLVAYIVAAEGESIREEELRHHLRQSLPEYMIPSAFVVLEAFPLSPNGKIDRKALPAPEYKVDEERYAAPRTPMEEMIAGIWAEVLRIPRVGVHDDFFALGGHSLLATQVISRIRSLGCDLPLRVIFEAPVLAELAKRADAAQAPISRQKQAIPRLPRTGPTPLSFAQQRLWFLSEFEPNNPVYNVPIAIGMKGELHFIALLRALNEIVNRHEVLHTTFAVRDNQPVQVISPEVKLELPIVELSGIPEDEQQASVKRLAIEGAQAVFNLETGPLFRANLLRLSDDEHVLLLNMHHIVGDAWSIWQFIRELAALYGAFIDGKPSPLSELPIQYSDYAVWQRDWMSGEVLAEHLDYWKKQLKDAPQVLELPADRVRPTVQTYRGAVLREKFPTSLLERLRALSKNERATLFMTLLAAFQTLLYRYTGQEDLVVGSPIAGRNRAEIEDLIGLFVNAVVLRTDLSGNPTFRELLQRVRAVALGAYAHQDLPLEKLVEALQPDRDLSRSPLFQVWFALQNVSRSELKLPGLELWPIDVHNGTSKFDLGVFAVEKPDGLLCIVEYSTDLFDDSTIRRLLSHFRMLLEGVAANPDQPISDLPLLTEAEKNQLLVCWNDTRVNYPRDLCLQQIIEEQVEKTPEAPAVIFESQQLTYRELNNRANRLAHRLRRLGVRPGVLAGICAERSIEMVVGLLGIMKAGGAYVPLDPDYPRDRLAMVLEDAVPPVVLTQEQFLEILPKYDSLVLCLDRDWRTLTDEPETNPVCITSGKDPAYAIFTSGSTGKPKGVPNVHAGIVNRLLWMQNAYKLDPTDRVLQKTPYSFDVSVWEFFWPLMTGACLVVAEPEAHKDPNYLIDLIVQQKITTVHFVPSMLRSFLEAERVEQCVSLRRVICSGEALPFELQQHFFDHLKAELHNLYGPTEASVDVTYWHCMPNSERSIVPIGKPIWNTQIYILDKRMQPVPVGVPGELHIGGVGLALGYLNRHQLTSEKFVADPFSKDASGRLYKTGDLARFLEDGNIEYLGRSDHQVKIRGFRIELGEIESVLAKHVSVRQCLVVAREDQPGMKRLVAYIVAAEGESIREEELRHHLRQSLPEYMIPSAFVVLEAFPLSPNGKIDRKALPAPEYKVDEERYAAPRTPMEEMIAGIWAEVLRIPRVGVHDDFFALGGHSLLATQVISRVRQACRVEIPLRALFEAPTVSGLAVLIEKSRRPEWGLDTPPIARVSRDQDLPLSLSQQRLWFLDQLDPQSGLYNVPRALRLKGELNVSAMEEALNGLIARHEILRTTYQLRSDHPVQVIAPQLTIDLPTFDLSSMPVALREEEAARMVKEQSDKGFNLSAGPVIRAMIVKLDEQDHILFLTTHHIATDGWSSAVMMNDLSEFYEAALRNRPSELSELQIQYADYAVWQRSRLQGEVLDKELAYWRAKLDGAPPVLSLPYDRIRPAVQTFRGAFYDSVLPSNITDALRKLGRQQGATRFMTLLAGFESLIHYHTGQHDIVLGTDLANRTSVETEALIGFFVNLVALRIDVSGNPSFEELIQRVREVSLDSYAHQDLPFDKLVEALQPDRNLSYSPVVQVLFVQQNMPRGGFGIPGLQISPFRVEVPSKFDLAVFITETENGVTGRWLYNPDLFEASTIARMSENYELLLQAGVQDPKLRLDAQCDLLIELEKVKRSREQKKFQETGREKLKKIRRQVISEV